MEHSKVSEGIINDIEELIDIDKQKQTRKESSIIFDGRQFSIKIPKEIAESVGIKQDEKIVFVIEKYPIEENKQTNLTIKLKRNND